MSKSDLTKQALDESFRSLLATKPLDHVTVTAIARNCGVNRQTFYYHFHDVYDLIHWSINTRIAAALPGGHDSEKWQDSLTVILHTRIDDRDLVIKLRHSIDSGLMHRYMRDEVGNLVIEAVTREFGPIEIPERDMVFISRFFAAGVTDAVLSWIDDGMHETPETLVSQFELLIRPDIARLVARLSNA